MTEMSSTPTLSPPPQVYGAARSTVLQLLKSADEPLTRADIKRQTGIAASTLDSTLAKLIKESRITKNQQPGVRPRFHLTQDQLVASNRKPAPVDSLIADGSTPVQISARLRFLTELQARPAFQGHAALAAIVSDYRLALKRSIEADANQGGAK